MTSPLRDEGQITPERLAGLRKQAFIKLFPDFID